MATQFEGDIRQIYLTKVPVQMADPVVKKHFEDWRRDLMLQLPQLIRESIASASMNTVALRMATAGSVPSDIPTILTWDTQDFGNNSQFGTVPTDRLIAPAAGLYLAYASIEWEFAFAGSRSLQLIENAANTPLVIDERPPTQPNPPLSFPFTSNTVIRTLVMVAGDYVRVRVFQNSGGPLNLVATAQAPIFGLTRLAFFP